MEESQVRTSDVSFSSLFDNGGKIALAIGGAAYVAGVLISNIYVVSFGFAAPDLTQPRYVVVGALWLFLLIALGSLAGLTKHFINAGVSSWKERKWFRALGKFAALPVAAFLSAATVTTITTYQLEVIERDTWQIVLILWLTAITISPAGRHVLALLSRRHGNARNEPLDTFAAIYGMLWQISLSLVLISAYAVAAYPKLPAAFGGGKSMPVRLLPTIDGTKAVKALGIKVLTDRLTEPLVIVYESEDMYFVTTLDVHDGRNRVGRRLAKILIDGAVAQKQR